MTFDLKAFKLQMSSIHSKNWIFEFDLTKNEFFLPCWVDDCYKGGTTWENLCRGKGRFWRGVPHKTVPFGHWLIHIKVQDFFWSWITLDCNTSYVKSYKSATLLCVSTNDQMIQSNVVPPYRNLFPCGPHHFLEYPF